jgi:hypothetical protein
MLFDGSSQYSSKCTKKVGIDLWKVVLNAKGRNGNRCTIFIFLPIKSDLNVVLPYNFENVQVYEHNTGLISPKTTVKFLGKMLNLC